MQQCLSKSIDIFFIFWLGVYFGVIVELSGECFYWIDFRVEIVDELIQKQTAEFVLQDRFQVLQG